MFREIFTIVSSLHVPCWQENTYWFLIRGSIGKCRIFFNFWQQTDTKYVIVLIDHFLAWWQAILFSYSFSYALILDISVMRPLQYTEHDTSLYENDFLTTEVKKEEKKKDLGHF